VVAPPQLGKTWFLGHLSTHPRLHQPDQWVVRKVDLRTQPFDVHDDAAALMRVLFDRGPALDARQEMRLIAQQIGASGNPHLCMVDSAELLTREATGALRSFLTEVCDYIQGMGNNRLRLAFIAASRRGDGWEGTSPQRMHLLPLTEFNTEVTQ
jgi:hypothetical protein